MTEEQLATIADMALTQEDMQAWTEEHGLGAGGGFPAGGDMSEEEREALRATREAQFGGEGVPPGGEGMPPGGEMPPAEDMPPEMATRVAEFQSMSEEERAQMRATMEAGGGMPGGRRGAPGAPGGAGPMGVLIRPLIQMLMELAG
jgi:hypothetical protein